MCPEGIWKWAQLKGISVIATGDFAHQVTKELDAKLDRIGNGFFALKKTHHADDVPTSCKADIQFILSAEISCIYSKNGKTRKVHSVLIAPDFETAARINLALSKIGNLNADGRPILGLDAKDLLKITLDVSPDVMLIPAHAWTPHFSVFGAVSGFDSLEECYEELTPSIFAIETGLSSDPLMNWQLSALERITLVSKTRCSLGSKDRARGEYLELRSLILRSLRPSRPARALSGLSSSFLKRVNIIMMAIGAAACASRRKKPSIMIIFVRSAIGK